MTPIGPMKPAGPNNRKIVYGQLRQSLIFIPLEEACRLARIHIAVRTCETWGEFRSKMPHNDYLHLLTDRGDRQTFAQFCADWINEVPTISEELATSRLRSALRSYATLPENERWPLARERYDFTDFLSDGDWPDWPAQMMLKWVPQDIMDQYGKRVSSVLNGFFLEFPAAKRNEIVAAFQAKGFECREDQALVMMASGEELPDDVEIGEFESYLNELEGRTPDMAATATQNVAPAQSWIDWCRRTSGTLIERERDYPLLKFMREKRIPITREAYLDLAYIGSAPKELSREEELRLPPFLRRSER